LGKGASLNTYATLKSLGDKKVFLSRGRETLASIEPGAQKEAIFTFEVKPDFSEKEARFEMAFADVDLREYLIEKISVPIHAASDTAALPPANAKEINSAPMLDIEVVQPVTKAGTVRIRGRAYDESKVRDVYIFVDNDKRFFAANDDANSPGALPFQTDLPIKNGINYITVVAEEDADLETRQVIAVRKDRPDGMPYILTRTLNMNDEAELLGVLPTNLERFTPIQGEVAQNLPSDGVKHPSE
jgi:hypothetical protein